MGDGRKIKTCLLRKTLVKSHDPKIVADARDKWQNNKPVWILRNGKWISGIIVAIKRVTQKQHKFRGEHECLLAKKKEVSVKWFVNGNYFLKDLCITNCQI